jgi:methionyl-tRNA formyltransferase
VRVAALGRTRMLLDAIRAVSESGHQVVLVASAPEAGGDPVTPAAFRAVAEELGCTYVDSPSLDAADGDASLRAAAADVAISVNWPTVIPPQALAAFPHGVLNAHAGDLPRFRGNATPNWAILAGEPEVVVTIHRMDEGLDSGPILCQRRFPLDDSTYVGDVYAFSERVVPEMFMEALDGLEQGTLAAMPQPSDPAARLRCLPRMPQDGWIDWSRDAVSLARLVRASAEPFAGAFTSLGTQRLVVWRAHAEELAYAHLGVPGQVAEVRATGEVAVLTGDGILVLERVQAEEQPAGGPPAELLRSTRMRLGVSVPALLDRLDELERRLGEGR